jgi:hypothetical protein
MVMSLIECGKDREGGVVLRLKAMVLHKPWDDLAGWVGECGWWCGFGGVIAQHCRLNDTLM